MPRFIQICASNDDLFALDEHGGVYQYNFNTKRWGKLVMTQDSEGGPETEWRDRRGIA